MVQRTKPLTAKELEQLKLDIENALAAAGVENALSDLRLLQLYDAAKTILGYCEREAKSRGLDLIV
jgi:hypothetical protein